MRIRVIKKKATVGTVPDGSYRAYILNRECGRRGASSLLKDSSLLQKCLVHRCASPTGKAWFYLVNGKWQLF